MKEVKHGWAHCGTKLFSSDGNVVAPSTSVVNMDVRRIRSGQHRAILMETKVQDDVSMGVFHLNISATQSNTTAKA
jgi:predicted hotdog family 3-hydroxylacyl-ACP dehydratase